MYVCIYEIFSNFKTSECFELSLKDSCQLKDYLHFFLNVN